MFDLQREIDNTTSGVIQLPYGETVEVDTLNIHREVCIQGATMLSGRIKCRKVLVPCRSSVILKNLRITGPGDGVGVTYDYAFSSSLERVLIEGFSTAVEYKAGNCWDITRCRIVASKIGVLVNNFENGDEGDWSITGTTIACSDGTNGDAGLLVESSGGGRLVDNKILGFKFSALLQTKCDSSVFLASNNSFELFSHMGVAGRVVSGSYSLVSIINNEFMSPTGGGVSMNKVNKVAVFGNTSNVPLPFYQKDGVAQSAEGANV